MFSRHEGTPVKMVDFREEREKRAFTRMEVSEREREREREKERDRTVHHYVHPIH